jgi:uncharacterized lipoprotein NlpE involved in copper resistance
MRALLLVLSFTLLGCNRPTEEECTKAVENLQKLRGLEHDISAPDPKIAIRKCRANGSKASTACLATAKTTAEADACVK